MDTPIETPIDMNEATEIVCNSKDLFIELFDILIDTLDEQLSMLEKAIEKQDFSTIIWIAHRMKSGLNSLAAKGAGDLAQRLENLSQTSSINDIQPVYKAYKMEVDRITAYYKSRAWESYF